MKQDIGVELRPEPFRPLATGSAPCWFPNSSEHHLPTRLARVDVSFIATPSPNFSEALGIRYPNPPSSETPSAIRSCVLRLRAISDRREKLAFGLGILHEMLYLAECPEDFLTIANLITEVQAELAQL